MDHIPNSREQSSSEYVTRLLCISEWQRLRKPAKCTFRMPPAFQLPAVQHGEKCFASSTTYPFPNSTMCENLSSAPFGRRRQPNGSFYGVTSIASSECAKIYPFPNSSANEMGSIATLGRQRYGICSELYSPGHVKRWVELRWRRCTHLRTVLHTK